MSLRVQLSQATWFNNSFNQTTSKAKEFEWLNCSDVSHVCVCVHRDIHLKRWICLFCTCILNKSLSSWGWLRRQQTRKKKGLERWNKTPGVCLWRDAPRGEKVNLACLGNGRKLLGGPFYSFGRHKNERVQPLQHHKVRLNCVTVFYISIKSLREKGTTTTTTTTRYHPTLRDHSLFVCSVSCFSLVFDLWLNSFKTFTKWTLSQTIIAIMIVS